MAEFAADKLSEDTKRVLEHSFTAWLAASLGYSTVSLLFAAYVEQPAHLDISVQPILRRRVREAIKSGDYDTAEQLLRIAQVAQELHLHL